MAATPSEWQQQIRFDSIRSLDRVLPSSELSFDIQPLHTSARDNRRQQVSVRAQHATCERERESSALRSASRFNSPRSSLACTIGCLSFRLDSSSSDDFISIHHHACDLSTSPLPVASPPPDSPLLRLLGRSRSRCVCDLSSGGRDWMLAHWTMLCGMSVEEGEGTCISNSYQQRWDRVTQLLTCSLACMIPLFLSFATRLRRSTIRLLGTAARSMPVNVMME